MAEHNHSTTERSDCTEVTFPDGQVIGVCVLTSEDGDAIRLGITPEEAEVRAIMRAEQQADLVARAQSHDERERARLIDFMARVDAETVLTNHLMSIATIRMLIDEQADCSCRSNDEPTLEQLITAARELGLLGEHDLIDLVVYATREADRIGQK